MTSKNSLDDVVFHTHSLFIINQCKKILEARMTAAVFMYVEFRVSKCFVEV